jgi:transposase
VRDPGVPLPPRSEQGLAALREAAAAHLSPGGQLQVATAAPDMLAATEARMDVVRKRVLDAARHLTGAKVLAARLYGVGPVTALALSCWLAGEGRFSSSRKAVRFTGLDITVWSSDRKGPPAARQAQVSIRGALGGSVHGPPGKNFAHKRRFCLTAGVLPPTKHDQLGQGGGHR